MVPQAVTSVFAKKLTWPNPASHKGENGRVLLIAGSDVYHGALLLALQVASRIVDVVYVYSTEHNLRLVEKLRSEVAVFIAIRTDELRQTVSLVDSIIIGPGMSETPESHALTESLLTDHADKKIVVDATALWHVDPDLLHSQSIVTPHSREFIHVFGCGPVVENVQKMAERYHCTIVLKGEVDYISNGQDVYENHTGNVGMTKGGTGDVLAGLIGALAATNDTLTAALLGIYLNGLAGDRLYERVGTFYNAEDVVDELGHIWKSELVPETN